MSPTRPIKVLAAPHTGITVRSLDRAIYLFRDLLGLQLQRQSRLHPPISTVTGHVEADIAIAIIELPGGHLLELLQYQNPATDSSAAHKPLSWEVGSWHLCLTMADLDGTISQLQEATWQGESMGWQLVAAPQVLTAGPNAGRRVCYVRDADGLTLEFFEGKVE